MQDAEAGPRDLRQGARWSTRQQTKNDIIYVVIRVALAIVARLPRGAVLRLCHGLGALAHLLLRAERDRAMARLEAGAGPLSGDTRVRAAFREAGTMLADTLSLLDPKEPVRRTLSLPTDAHAVFEQALAEGRGVVFVSAHLGPWERLAAVLAEEGFPVATVARKSYDPRLTAIYERVRAPRRVRSIYRGESGSAFAVLRELRRGRAVGFLIDLPARVPSVRSRLFGAEFEVPVGPARIALALRSAVVVGTTSPDRTIRIRRIAHDDLAPGAAGEEALTARLVRELDSRIAECPEAWLGLFASSGERRP